MGWLIRKLRDLEAFLTSYGQCARCRKSWRTASPVSVWHSSTEATFLLCIDCWSDIVGEQDPHAGLILQGYAENHLIRHPRSDEVVVDILAAYGMAWRCGVEWRPQWRRPLMFDVRPMLRRRADLSPTGEKVPLQDVRAKRDLFVRAFGLTAEEEARWDAAVASGEALRAYERLIGMHDDHGHHAADGADGRDGHAS